MLPFEVDHPFRLIWPLITLDWKTNYSHTICSARIKTHVPDYPKSYYFFMR